MLTYRKVSLEGNQITIDNLEVKEDLKKLILIENEKRLSSSWKNKEKSVILTFNICGDVKFLDVCKNDSIYDLKKAVLREYKMDGWENDKNFRLRVISNNMFLKESFPNEEVTLEEAGIYNNKIYSLEKKRDQEEFEEYSENMMSIVVYFWSFRQSNFEYKTLRVNKAMKMSEFKEQIRREFRQKESEELFSFKKVDLNSNQYNLIEIFDENNLNKSVESCVFEGMRIYTEVLDPNTKISKFKKKFDERYQFLQIKFNNPVTPDNIKNANTRSTRYQNQIEILKSSTVKELREKIAQYLNIEPNEFIMKKFSHMGLELKNPKEQLDKLTNSVLTIYLEYGNPLSNGILILTKSKSRS